MRIMKKIACGAISVFLAAGLLAGCGSEEEDLPLAQLKTEKYVTLGDYRNMTVSVTQPEPDDEYTEQVMLGVYIKNISADNGGIKDRAVKEGDTVNIDYVGKMDGVPFANGSDAGALLTIGSGQFIDGFEDGLIGVMPGETVDLDISFPDPYYNNPDLSGQPVVFTVTVKFILPVVEGIEDMQDAVVPDIGIEGVSTVEEFRQYVYDYLDELYSSSLQSAIIQKLLAQCEFKTLPEHLLELSRESLTTNMMNAFAEAGISADEFAYYNGMTISEYVENYAPDGVKQELALQAIANKEGLAVDDEELQLKMEEFVAANGYESVEQLVSDNDIENIRNYFMSLKVLEYLKENVQIN